MSPMVAERWRRKPLFASVELKLETASEFGVEGHAKGHADVVLRGAAEAGDQVISLEQADRN